VSLRRRELIRVSAAAGAGALALPLLAGTGSAGAATRGDRETLIEVLELERRLEGLYGVLAGRGGPHARTAERFGAHCREHARGLGIALANRGGAPDGASPRGGEATLPAALELETVTVAAYYVSHGDFRDAALLPTLTSIMANHGQHLVVLRQRVGERPATLALESGGVE
jgi:hypothetical protein